MTLSVQSYETLAQQLADTMSDDAQAFMVATQEKSVDVAMCALDLYLNHLYDDASKLDEYEMDKKTGKPKLDANKQPIVTSRFLDSFPQVGTEEDEDQDVRNASRGRNEMYEYFYRLGDNAKMTKVSVFDDYAERTTIGREKVLRLKAVKQLIEKTGQQLPESSPFQDLNHMGGSELRVEKSNLTGEINRIANMTRDAVHIYQQQKAMRGFTRYGNVPGIVVDLAQTKSGSFLRTKKPFVLTDTEVKPIDQREYSVSSFLSFDVAAAIVDNSRGTPPLEALRKTLKRGKSEGTKTVTITPNMGIDDYTKAINVILNFHRDAGRDKGVDIRIADKKKGKALLRDMLHLFYDYLQPTLDNVEMQNTFKQMNNAEADELEESNNKQSKVDEIKQQIEKIKRSKAPLAV